MQLNTEAKETQQLNPCGPDNRLSIGSQPSHLYIRLVVEASSYSDMVECLPLDPAPDPGSIPILGLSWDFSAPNTIIIQE